VTIRGILSLAGLVLVGCATISQEQQFNYQGNVALSAEQYEVAIENYRRAYQSAGKAGNHQYAAIAAYGLGRAYGYTCDFDLAVRWFNKSIALRTAIPDSEIAYLSQSYLELARLYTSSRKWADAIANFSQAVHLLESANIEDEDPIGYADVLETYKVALTEYGDEERAKAIETQIQTLRSANPGRRAGFSARPYPERCP
jgi:tetratricopeptide (TPR) repeat protein